MPTEAVPAMSDADRIAALLKDRAADQVTKFSPSPYETGQYLRISERADVGAPQIDYLLATQRPDGLWGSVGFELVPTLGAVAGLSSRPEYADRAGVADAVARACGKLWELALGAGGLPKLPDTVASEIIVPSLIDVLGEVLHRHCPAACGKAGHDREFPNPPGAKPELWRRLNDLIAQGQAIPKTAWHTLEAFHPLPQQFAATVKPAADGAVTCSPSSTVAWVSAVGTDAGESTRAYLEEAQSRYRGAIPMGSSMPYFEALWVLNLVLKYFPDVPIPKEVVEELAAGFGDSGIGGGPGLPPDGDDTAYANLAGDKLGAPTHPEILMKFWDEDHFVSYPTEQTPSETVNAHALEYLNHLRMHRDITEYGAVEDACAEWVIAQQTEDGCWYDKWNVSPYYSTTACVEALLDARKQDEPQLDSLRRAREWLLRNQTDSGGWGMAEPSSEETAYAVMALDLFAGRGGKGSEECAAAISRAKDFLKDESRENPPLWMGKDLYTPFRIVDVTVLCGRAVVSRY
ncbi:prenyltransferase/squalene oxidase repeat-containing protein [Streptomyces sp. NPDC058067]|uniref:prenyltransferase/squalene oxidase repeat-containing protein n=1 Tax=Streptomyces sp. NPDC058067 TaxID=3346324 RepID=UPI0036E71213